MNEDGPIEEQGFRSVFYTSFDGLRLYGRDYGPLHDPMPLVCLPGLTRNSADFHRLALFLSQASSPARRVVSLDYRGRGESQYDLDWKHYDPQIEAKDVIDFLKATHIKQGIFLGTSRGGLVTLALAMMQPSLIRGVILNDIGPVVEKGGLARIQSYVGKFPKPSSYEEGAQILKQASGNQFPALSNQDWMNIAHRNWKGKEGELSLRYDVGLMKSFARLDVTKGMPPLWPLFASLFPFPLLIIRGENSDLLSAATVEEMLKQHPAAEAILVPNEGHAPLLEDHPTMEYIYNFAEKVRTYPAPILPSPPLLSPKRAPLEKRTLSYLSGRLSV